VNVHRMRSIAGFVAKGTLLPFQGRRCSRCGEDVAVCEVSVDNERHERGNDRNESNGRDVSRLCLRATTSPVA
jgi:hypothetical protein